MPVLDILTAPHPILEKRARDVEADEFGDELVQRVSDMAETMYAAPGVGLAAPQVNDPRRLLVMDPGEKEERGRRFFAMANPAIVEHSQDTIDWNETCLSVPEFEIELRRWRRVKVAWQDCKDGSPKEGWFEDYEAVIVQHELDHLAGTVLLDKASRFKRSWYLRRVSKLKKREKVTA
ncbi:MAG: peptide deformylase [Myxococcales bacterium]|nr:peptide deformylase [Myxococcales bacterium]